MQFNYWVTPTELGKLGELKVKLAAIYTIRTFSVIRLISEIDI